MNVQQPLLGQHSLKCLHSIECLSFYVILTASWDGYLENESNCYMLQMSNIWRYDVIKLQTLVVTVGCHPGFKIGSWHPYASQYQEGKKKVKQPSLSLKDMLFEMVGCLKKTVNWSRTGQEMDWHKHGKKQDGARRFCIRQVIPQIAKTELISVYAPCHYGVPVNPTSSHPVSHAAWHFHLPYSVYVTTPIPVLLMSYRWIKSLLFLDWESYARRFN